MSNLLPHDVDSILRQIPSGADPFDYISKLTMTWFSLTLSKYTIVVLIIILLFHAMVFLFCLILLIKSYISGTGQARWLFKRLYINDRRGFKAYNCPLYFLNAGILMAFSQMLSSGAAAAYVYIILKSNQTPESAVDEPIIPPLAIMSVCEVLSHWSVTHCFLVTIYASRGFHQKMRVGILGWISPPVVINLVFFGIPITGLTVASIMFYWITRTHHQLGQGVLKLLDKLNVNSSAWKQLYAKPPPPPEEMSRISIQLLQQIPKLKKNYLEIIARTEYFLYSFHQTQIALMVISYTTCFIFIVMFCIMILRYRNNDENSDSNCAVALPRTGPSLNWLKREKQNVPSSPESESKFRRHFRMLVANKKLVYLVVRGVGIFLSMLTQMATCSLYAIKTREVILDRHLREIADCIVITSGTWSAIPIAWQCWRLYVDQTNDGTAVTSKKETNVVLPTKKKLKFNEIVELEMRREKELEILEDNNRHSHETY